MGKCAWWVTLSGVIFSLTRTSVFGNKDLANVSEIFRPVSQQDRRVFMAETYQTHSPLCLVCMFWWLLFPMDVIPWQMNLADILLTSSHMPSVFFLPTHPTQPAHRPYPPIYSRPPSSPLQKKGNKRKKTTAKTSPSETKQKSENGKRRERRQIKIK